MFRLAWHTLPYCVSSFNRYLLCVRGPLANTAHQRQQLSHMINTSLSCLARTHLDLLFTVRLTDAPPPGGGVRVRGRGCENRWSSVIGFYALLRPSGPLRNLCEMLIWQQGSPACEDLMYYCSGCFIYGYERPGIMGSDTGVQGPSGEWVSLLKSWKHNRSDISKEGKILEL